MNINLLVTTPLTFSLVLPDKPTKKEKAIHDVIQSLGAEWVEAGQSATRKLWCVITQTNDMSGLRAAITKYKLPITILMAQNAHKTPKVDANGDPVLDADGNQVMALVVHDPTTKSVLLKYMPDIPILNKKGVVTGTKAATQVTLPQWGGHEPWSV